MAKLSEEKIAEIRRVYHEIGTYSGTAKTVGCSPATVKKYAQEDYVPDESLKVPFDKSIPSMEEMNWPSKEEIKNMVQLSEEEKIEIEELWKEI